MMERVYVAGHNGLVGSAIIKRLCHENTEIITANKSDLDLRDQSEVRKFFKDQKPTQVYLAAAKVGGILANDTKRADFLYDNVMIATNVIHSAYEYKCDRLLFLGSSCIYPKNSLQPMKENYLLTGPLEQTNEPYAIAKIAGVKLVENYNRQYNTNFISVMPTNLYGPNDNFNLNNSHVLPAMIRRFHDAVKDNTKVVLWGDGSPRREFLYSEDCADACVFIMNNVNAHQVQGDIINIGCGYDISIMELANMVKTLVGYDGEIIWDKSKPNGTFRKLQDISILSELGWNAKINLNEGLKRVYDWFIKNQSFLR